MNRKHIAIPLLLALAANLTTAAAPESDNSRRYRRIALRTIANLAARESAAQAFPNIVVEK